MIDINIKNAIWNLKSRICKISGHRLKLKVCKKCHPFKIKDLFKTVVAAAAASIIIGAIYQIDFDEVTKYGKRKKTGKRNKRTI